MGILVRSRCSPPARIRSPDTDLGHRERRAGRGRAGPDGHDLRVRDHPGGRRATHLGHAATFLAWDLLIRSWLDGGKQVTYVQNVTDVDDPLLERAERDGEDWREMADRQIALYRSDMTALRVLPPAHYIGAVESMPLIEEFNRTLSKRGSLYEIDGDVYFSRSADPYFGSVSGLDADTMVRLAAENGGDPGRPGKKDPVDPMVWLTRRPGETSRPSEFGRVEPAVGMSSARRSRRAISVRPSTCRRADGT